MTLPHTHHAEAVFGLSRPVFTPMFLRVFRLPGREWSSLRCARLPRFPL